MLIKSVCDAVDLFFTSHVLVLQLFNLLAKSIRSNLHLNLMFNKSNLMSRINNLMFYLDY